MKTLVFCGVLFSLLGTSLSAQAIPTIELKEQPPLKSLHNCQDSEGKVKSKIEECGLDETEVSSITTIRNGKVIHAPLGETLDTWNPDAKPGTSVAAPSTPVAAPTTPVIAPDALAQPPNYKRLQSQIFSFFIVSLIVSIIAARRGRSGVMTFLVCVLGTLLLNSVVVAVQEGNSGAGSTATMVSFFVVPAIMLIRALSSDST